MDKDKENNIVIPTREEFEEFCSLKLGYNDKEFTSELWKTCCRVGWRKKNGDAPKSWQILVVCYNGILLLKFGRKPYKRTSASKKDTNTEEEFPDNGLHYIAYTDGSCDNYSKMKAGGSAYILMKDGDVVKIKNHGQLSTTNNRILLEYARYLDKDLAVIVNEVFLQEVAAQQNPELYIDKYRKAYKKKGKDDAWINERMKGINSRKELTATLGSHGVTEGHEFRECTNASYTGLFGINAPAIREGLGITKKQSIRDNMNQTELIALSLSENLTKKDIEKRNLCGVKDCSLSCHDAAKSISSAVQNFLNR